MSLLRESLPYRPCVGIMLLNNEGKVFVAKRIDTVAEAWQMPQGGIDAGEPPFSAAMREMLEEIGTDKALLVAESREWLNYDLPDHLIGKLWGGEFRGQRQKWYCLRFMGVDSDININTAHPEFLEWQWVDIHRLPEIIVPFKRALYTELVREFSVFACPL